jgi:hypothetical protein
MAKKAKERKKVHKEESKSEIRLAIRIRQYEEDMRKVSGKMRQTGGFRKPGSQQIGW